jgi:O-antigen/teichoic acid export membrane protein
MTFITNKAEAELHAVIKNCLQVFSIRILGAAATYGSMVVLARYLGSFEFGIYAYAIVFVALMALATSFGFNSSGLRFVADYLSRGKKTRLAGFLAQSLWLVLAFSVSSALIGVSVAFTFRSAIPSHYFEPLLVGLLCVPIFALMNQCETTARAFRWVNVAYVPGYILRPLLLATIVGGLALVGKTIGAASAMWAMFAGSGLVLIGQITVIYIKTREKLAETKPVFHTRHWLSVSLSFFTMDGFRMLLDNTDVMLLARFLDPQSVAIYFSVIRTSGLIAFVSFSVLALAVPKYAELHSKGDRNALQKYVSSSVQMMFWPSVVAALAMMVCGRYFLSMFGPEFTAGYSTMLVILFGIVLRSATLPVEYLLNMSGHHRDTLRVYAVMALVNVGLNVLLIPRFGIIGAAVGTYVAIVICNIWLSVIVKKRLGVNATVLAFWMNSGRTDRKIGRVAAAR